MSCGIAAIGQLAISCAVGYVAWRQWKTAHDKLRLDLYEKRFRILNTTTDFISDVLSGEIKQEQMVKFLVARSEATFLFAGDKELLNFLDDLTQKSRDLAIWRDQAKQVQQPGSEPSKQRDALQKWFLAQFDVARKQFAAHLSFG
jgi:hypothetical protein